MNDAAILEMLNGCTIESMSEVIPFPGDAGVSTSEGASHIHTEMGAVIGVTGDCKGQLVIDGTTQLFSKIGESMYGMALEGEMLSSFVGEIGNMIAGGAATKLFKHDIKVDITPPLVLEGNISMPAAAQAISTKISFQQNGDARLYLILNGTKGA